MKKFFIILLVIIVVLLGAAIALPFIFKNDIKLAIQRVVEKNVKAKVFFDENKIGVSIFKNFPNITLSLRDFGVVGIDPFQEDTLFSAAEFGLTVDIKSVIFGSKINLKSINLDNPRIFVLVLKDGRANYDIMIDSGAPADTATSGSQSEMKIGIQSWNIKDGQIIYYDQSMKFIMGLYGLNHAGSGDFTTSVFDMKTHTVIDKLLMSYDGVDYLKNQKLVADIVMNMDLNTFKFTFKENSIKLNDFGLMFDGFFAMPKEGFDMDINFKSPENTVKSLLSLVPSAYMKGYENIKAEGDFNFSGFLKGLYSDSLKKMPAFNFALKASNGMIQYPDLHEAVKNINIDFLVNNPDGVIEHTVVDLKKFHLDIGQNPVDATLHVDNLRDYKMKASLDAKFNLGDVLKIMPMDSTSMSGMLTASLSVDGVYDSVKHVIPAQGRMNLTDFAFKNPSLPQGVKITSTQVDINPARVVVDHFNGSLGKSDMSIKGFVGNYVDYIFSKNAVISGQLDFSSKMFDLNEWMTEDSTAAKSKTDTLKTPIDTTSYALVQIPGNIDFTLNASIDKLNYTNLELTGFRGILLVRDGVLKMKDLGFNTLGGKFGMDGTYDTRDLSNPLFDFNFKIQDLSIPTAYKSFVTIRKLAPIAKVMEGNFSTDFKLGGKLQKNYMPDDPTLQGNGVLKIADAKVAGSQSKLVAGISSVTKLGGSENGDIILKDVLIKAEIINGRVFLEPFNVKIGKNNALIAGSSGMDGSLDYKIKMDVPAEALNAAASLVSSLSGQKMNMSGGTMKINLGVKGNYDNPKVTFLGAETGAASAAAKDQLKTSVNAEKDKLAQKAKQELDSLAAGQKQNVKKEVKKEVEKTKDKLMKLFKGGGN
jgi:hypothetical protein